MNEKHIISKIKNLAEELTRNGQPITRADLAYELKDFGIAGDSFVVTEWVWKAYSFYDNSQQIRKSFVNNERKNYLVDEYQIYPVLEEGNSRELSGLLTTALEDSKEALESLDDCLVDALQEKVLKASGDVVGHLTGTKGVSEVKTAAASVMERYTNLVNAYDDAKGDVKAMINTFIALRDYIDEIYRKYTLALTDIFGNSIKAISPELFDFDSIQWLDVRGMLENVQLEYNQLMNRCGELMSSISTNFSSSLKSASANYRLADNKKVGLFLAGIEMINHYLDVSQQTNELRAQLLTLKKTVKHDATQIKGDMGRLSLIYKGMNDYHIPRAEAFYRYSRIMMENDFNAILSTLYAHPKVAALKQERDELLKELADVSRCVADSQMNIDYYSDHVAECGALITSMESQYREAKNSKPEKPFFLFNLLSFGSMNTKYNREMASWYQACQPVIKQYEALKVDVNLDEEDLAAHKKIHAEGVRNRELLLRKLEKSTLEMQKALQVDVDTQRKLVAHLEDLIKLLRVAREILNTSLDDKLVKTVVISDYRKEQLPSEISQHISTFSQSLSGVLTADHSTARQSLDKLSKHMKGRTQSDDYTEEELNTVAEAQQQVVQKAISIFESWADLQKQQVEGRIIAKKYEQELTRLQQTFQEEMKAIDNQSEVLHQVIRKMNTTQDDDVLRQALLSLAQVDDQFSEEDWTEFFNGSKTIII